MQHHQHSEEGNVELEGNPRLLAGLHPLSMVYGGGGAFGIAYGAGVVWVTMQAP